MPERCLPPHMFSHKNFSQVRQISGLQELMERPCWQARDAKSFKSLLMKWEFEYKYVQITSNIILTYLFTML